MRLQRVDDSLPPARPAQVEHLLTGLRIVHGLTALLPGLLVGRLLGDQTEFDEQQAALLLLFGLLTVLLFQAFGLYSNALFSNRLGFRPLLGAWSAAFALLLLMHQGLPQLPTLPGRHLILWFALGLFGFALERLCLLALFRRLMGRGLFLQNAIILGCTENGLRLADYLGVRRDIRLGLLGFIDDRLERFPATLAGLPVLGDSDDLERLILERKISLVLVALPWTAESRIGRLLERLSALPVSVLLAPDILAFRHAQNRVSKVAGLALFNASQTPLRGWSPRIKRLEDLLLAGLALPLLLPLMLLVALAIKLDAPGPALLRLKRFGYNGQQIELYQFRTPGAQDSAQDEPGTGSDSFIRRARLYKLPQLFNVLGGSLSLVGPPLLESADKSSGLLFEATLDRYSAHHAIKPGITGWAQLHDQCGESGNRLKIAQRIELDLEYMERWSPWLDLSILLRSLIALLLPREGCQGTQP